MSITKNIRIRGQNFSLCDRDTIISTSSTSTPIGTYKNLNYSEVNSLMNAKISVNQNNNNNIKTNNNNKNINSSLYSYWKSSNSNHHFPDALTYRTSRTISVSLQQNKNANHLMSIQQSNLIPASESGVIFTKK